MPVVEAKPKVGARAPVVRLTADLQRSTISALENEHGQPFVIVTAEPLRLDRARLFEEADTEFGLCLVIRLTGHAPAIGILRQTNLGFREYWRTLAPTARALLRRLEAAVEEAQTVPVFWRTADGAFVEFHLGGYNRQHRVWYSRLDGVEPDAPEFLLCSTVSGEPERRPIPYGGLR
ncbi:MAG: hypothetical protein KatS3mg060_3655 [Dehalococcoidia bacterium]|jgi:hypothetical protein|nr:MAG: hypothetical protein KatS3mg060_3655 [Dehalococcoidia bacterium]